MFQEAHVELLSFEKCLYLYIINLLINSTSVYPGLALMLSVILIAEKGENPHFLLTGI